MKYKSEEERKAAAKAYQAAYRKARKDGTWRPKSEIGKGRVIVQEPPHTATEATEAANVQQQEPQVNETGLKGMKDMTPEERTAAKSAYQRRYRELKRLAYHLRVSEPGGPATGCAGKPKRTRKKYATAAEAKAASLAYHRAYGKKYRALKKSGEWRPRAATAARKGGYVRTGKPCGRKPKYATEAERLAAKREYNREYHLRRKAGGWERKNRVFSERVARSAGVKTVSAEIRSRMALAPAVAFESIDAWEQARATHIAELRAKREATREYVLKKYGFDPAKRPAKDASAEELAAREEWRLERGRLEYRRKIDKLQTYNREYRRRKRAEALAEAQKVWTAEEWAAWEAKKRRKFYGEGTTAFVVKGVVKLLAEQGGVEEDLIMEKLMENGCIEFISQGVESYKEAHKSLPNGKRFVKTVARAVAFFLDPDSAVMFPNGEK